MKRTFKNREKQGRETNLWIKLFDTEKGFIGEFEINPSSKNLPACGAVGRPSVCASDERRTWHLLRKSSRVLPDSGSSSIGPSVRVLKSHKSAGYLYILAAIPQVAFY